MLNKAVASKKPKKISRQAQERRYYSPIQNSSPKDEKKQKYEFNNQQIDFEPDNKFIYVENKLIPNDGQNVDSTLQLTVDDKETYNMHPKDEEGLLERR